MKLRRSTTISREGWYYLLVFGMIFGGALMREVNLLVVLAGMLAGPLLLSRFTAVQMLRGLSVQRRVPHGVCAGDLLVANVTLSNPRKRLGSWAVLVEEPVCRETEGEARPAGRREPEAEACVLFPYVPAGQSRKGDYRGRLERRGRYRLGPVRISTRFPFGLLRHTVTLGSTASLTVFPRLGRLTQRWMARHNESFAGTHRRERRPGTEGDFYGVRPWRRGDSRRWIHGRTSARAGKLMVRQFEQPRNRNVAILLDLWRPEQPGPDHLDSVEQAVSFAATIVADLCRKGGSDLHLGMADPLPRLAGGPASAALLQDSMERLARIEGQPRDHLPDLLEQTLRQIEPGTEIVLISTRPVDLADAGRLGRLGADAAQRAALRRIRSIDASSEELAHFFQAE